MKRLRKVLRRSLKPFVLAAVAVGLCFSLTVTTTQRAEANPLLLPPLILASGTMPVGTALGLVSLTGPLGWGIAGVAVLGLGLAATQDYWLPYVTGEAGKPKESGNLNDPATGGFGSAELIQNTANLQVLAGSLGVTNDGGIGGIQGLSVRLDYVGTSTASTLKGKLEARMNCQRPDGSRYQKVAMTGDVYFSANARNPTITYGPVCSNGAGGYDRVLGLWAGPLRKAVVTAAGGNPSEANVWTPASSFATWGTQATSTEGASYDPRGENYIYKTTVECVRADGTFFELTAESKGTDGAVKMPSCAAADPGAHGTGKTEVKGTAPGGQPETMMSNPRIGASAEYPLCGPDRPGLMCSLSVAVDGKACAGAVGSWDCANWRQIANQNSARVQCSYGPYAGLAVDVCNPMERAYESPSGVPGTEANLDGNPATRNDSSPQGEPYQKPDGSTVPGTGMGTAPSSGTNPGTTAGESGQNCLSQGWSWNPVSWVMVPTQCALQWAFVPPKTRIDAAIDTVIPKMELRGINPFVIPVMTSLGSLSGSGCQGPAFDLSAIHIPQTYYFFSACEAPMSHIATGVNSFFALSIVVQGGMSCIRGVAAAFGFNWGLGKGGEDDK